MKSDTTLKIQLGQNDGILKGFIDFSVYGDVAKCSKAVRDVDECSGQC